MRLSTHRSPALIHSIVVDISAFGTMTLSLLFCRQSRGLAHQCLLCSCTANDFYTQNTCDWYTEWEGNASCLRGREIEDAKGSRVGIRKDFRTSLALPLIFRKKPSFGMPFRIAAFSQMGSPLDYGTCRRALCA